VAWLRGPKRQTWSHWKISWREIGFTKKESFYKDLGPGMETYNDAMGYNASFPFHVFTNLTDIIIVVGDVVGIALFMRFLLTTDDRKLYVRP